MLFKEDVYERWECQQASEDEGPVGLMLKKYVFITTHRTSVYIGNIHFLKCDSSFPTNRQH